MAAATIDGTDFDRALVHAELDGTVEITDEGLRARVRAAVRGE
ncbi:hypothetical protein [Streptomyces sp. NPDC054874]